MIKKTITLIFIVLNSTNLNAGVISNVEPFMTNSVNSINNITNSQIDIDKGLTDTMNSDTVTKLKENQTQRTKLLKENEMQFKSSNVAYKNLLFKLKKTNHLEYLNGN